MDYFSLSKKLMRNKLPTNIDIIRAFVFEKDKWLIDNQTKKEPENSVIAEIITNKIQQIYGEAGIKTLRTDKIKEKVKRTYNSRLKLLKISRSKRHKETFSKKIEMYKSDLFHIFEVTSSNNKSKRNKKGLNELKSNSHITADQYLTSDKRTAALFSRQKTYAMAMQEEDLSEESNEIPDRDFEVISSKAHSVYTKPIDLSEIVEIQSRFPISDRATSATINATLRIFGIPPAVDKSKLRRAQKRYFADIANVPVVSGGGLFYDSRKDHSITSQRKRVENGKFKYYRTTRREEHYSLVSQPDGLFLGFVTVENGLALTGSEAILSFLKKKKILNELEALGCDGTNVNVGHEGGINQYIEAELKRPLHWFVCLLHANEIPLKTLITKLDGPTTGKNSFSGPIGKAIENVCDSTIVPFKTFHQFKKLERFPQDVYKKLSNDQKYLYRIVNALISGNFSESLIQLKIGPINHSRWITTACRICRLYASTRLPSESLIIITSYIVNVYAPTWFQIKRKELAVDGPRNLFFLIEKSKSIEDENARSIVQKCIKRNAFFAHSENVLLAQLASEKKTERVDAVNKILNMREKIPDDVIRLFKVPKINFSAKTWTDIAVPNALNMTEPPFTRDFNEDELMDIIQNPLQVPKFKCHTQMVERVVKEVTRVSSKVISHEKRNSMVKATLINRAKFPKFDSLKDHFIENHDEPVCFLPKA